MSYGTSVSELTGVDGEYWLIKLADAIACGSVTYIMDDTGPDKPARVYVGDLDPMLQKRIWESYDAANEELEELHRNEEALNREYGEPMHPAINMDVLPAWATAAIRA